MAASFFISWQQDKTAHHSPETATDTLNLSYSHAEKPYFMLDVTNCYIKNAQFVISRSNDLLHQERSICYTK